MTPDETDAPTPRFFSLEEANRMLPLVRRIVDDIMGGFAELRPMAARFNALPVAERGTGAGRGLREEVERRSSELDALVAELHDLGCLFKGVPDGLVDWYSYYAGRPVFLCWKQGEPEIEWWHQVDAGFIGRQRILPSQRSEFRGTR